MGDLHLLDNLVREYQQRFVAFACSYVKDLADAEDIVAEAFAAFWIRRDSLPEDVNGPAYILTTIKNKSLNFLKESRNRLRTDPPQDLTDLWDLDFRISSLQSFDPHDIFRKEILGIARKTLENLPEKTREVFNLSRIGMKKNREIAEMLGISEKGVEYHITKALSALRQALQDYIPFSVLVFLI